MLTKKDLDLIRHVVRDELAPIKNEIKEMKEDIRTVDMKVELVNTKVETLRGDTRDGFERVFEAIEQNDAEQRKNMRQLKDIVGIN